MLYFAGCIIQYVFSFSNAKPFRSQKVKEGPATRMGVPVPSQPEESSSARSNPQAATDARWATLPRRGWLVPSVCLYTLPVSLEIHCNHIACRVLL